MFQDRFKSEPVEDDAYLLTVVRYIHQNPLKAGLCKNIDGYKYSSYNEYTEIANIVDTDFCFGIINKEQFVDFHKEENEDVCLELEENNFRMTDDEARGIMHKVSKCKTISEFQNLPISKKEKYLKMLRIQGLSIRQISRLTGISFNIVRKY